MKKPIWTVALLSILISNAGYANVSLKNHNDLRLLETSPENLALLQQSFGDQITVLGRTPGRSLFLAQKSLLKAISADLHEANHHCGGFLDVTDEPIEHFQNAALETEPGAQANGVPLPKLDKVDPAIQEAVDAVEPQNIQGFVLRYASQFKTRVADSAEGVKAAEWLHDEWSQMAAAYRRPDITVELIKPHTEYAQNSVRITILGTDSSRGIVILGAHLDSINQGWFDKRAPGMDDDASGIATVTEVYRIMLSNNFRPAATVQIFGYAAEEEGLVGSRAIAQSYRDINTNVIGVLQLDMTAYQGDTHAVTFYRDYTSDELTQWTEQLYSMYVPGMNIAEDKCGYACSDHASWTRYGYRSIMPFESHFKDSNPRIHSADDIWDDSLDANYAALFAKLAVAFSAELAR